MSKLTNEFYEMDYSLYSKVTTDVADNTDSISTKETLILYTKDAMPDSLLASVLHNSLDYSLSKKNGGYATMDSNNPFRFRLQQTKPIEISHYSGVESNTRTNFTELVVIEYDKMTNEYKILLVSDDIKDSFYPFNNSIMKTKRTKLREKEFNEKVDKMLNIFETLDNSKKIEFISQLEQHN